jgi:glycosyltransferase involved in cell wall biosynthesis
MTVKLFFRKPGSSHFSIEGLFRALVTRFPDDIHIDCCVCPQPSRGFFKRLVNIWSAHRMQGEVNHITGDVHYLTIGLNPKRTILTIHDCATLDRLKGWRKAIYKFFWFDWPLRNVAWVTVISKATHDHLLASTKVDPSKIRIIPDCISDSFKKTSHNFNSIKPRVLQIGTSYNKNIERVAEALRGLTCSLRIIGLLNESQRKALVSAGIEFTTTANLTEQDLIKEYCAADLVTFVSTIEGFGMPILEAQTVGRVVVTSDCSSMPEVAGKGACLVNPFDVSSIREGIVRVIKDETYRNSLILSGFENIKMYSPSVTAMKYCALYRAVAAQKNKGNQQ